MTAELHCCSSDSALGPRHELQGKEVSVTMVTEPSRPPVSHRGHSYFIYLVCRDQLEPLAALEKIRSLKRSFRLSVSSETCEYKS